MTRKHWIWIGAALVGVLLIGGAAFALQRPLAFANLAVTYAAKQTCTCVYVSGRDLESCVADFPEEAGKRIKVSIAGDHVRASAYGMFKAEAVNEEGFGCRILN